MRHYCPKENETRLLKITKVTPLMLDRYLLVQVETDAGITGLGESGAWGFLEASYSAIEKFGRYLIGEDPLRIEHHWQYMYRFSHFRGAAIMGALSAIDIALWDIMGKHFDTPVHSERPQCGHDALIVADDHEAFRCREIRLRFRDGRGPDGEPNRRTSADCALHGDLTT